MCGIAGYNCSPEWTAKYIGDNQKNILREGWLHNQHRGEDAAGYFSFSLDDEFSAFKSDGAANELIEKVDPPLSRVMGMHTRAWTQGDPKQNRNNHPVSHKGVHVVHNGHISNDDIVLKSFGAGGKKSPEVDSWAIPVALSQCADNPYDLDGIADALDMLYGGWAINAVWTKFPGVSVIGKGNSSPLVVGVHQAGAVFYASEMEALCSMIRAQTVDGQYMDYADKGWDYYSLKPGALLIVEDGKIIDNGAIRYRPTKNNGGKADFSVTRMSQTGKEVYQSNWNNDFAVKNVNSWSMFDDDDLDYNFTPDGPLPGMGTWPTPTDNNMFAAFGDADYAAVRGDLVHIMVGNVEVVMTKQRTIKDIFNHDLDHERFVVETLEPGEAERPVLDTQKAPDEFLRTHGKYEYQVPIETSLDSYEYEYNPKIRGVGNGGTALKASGDTLGGIGSPPELSVPEVKVTLNNYKDELEQHNAYGDLFFLKAVKCPDHQTPFKTHLEPMACDKALYAAAYSLAAIKDLRVYPKLSVNWDLNYERPFDQGFEPCVLHDFMRTEYVNIQYGYKVFPVMTEQTCTLCNLKISLQDLPSYFEYLTLREIISKEVAHAN